LVLPAARSFWRRGNFADEKSDPKNHTIKTGPQGAPETVTYDASAEGERQPSFAVEHLDPRSSGRVIAWTPEALHRRYAGRIDRQIRALLGADDEREDLVQEVLIAVFNRIGTLRDPACIDGWVSQITVNTLRHTIRKRRLRRHACWEALPEDQNPMFHVDVDGYQLASRAIRVMERLPQGDRALLTRYWLSATTIRAIAAESSCSVITVRRRLFRAQARFERLARLDPDLAARIDAGARRRKGRRTLSLGSLQT
jgi:RNA polymerase sigma-70 factor, ECF subfamily